MDELIEETMKDLPCPIFKYRALNVKEPTYIVYYIWSDVDTEFAGDEAIMSAAKATVSIYSPREEKLLIKEVKARLRKAGFYVSNNYGVYSQETGRIQTIIEIQYEDFYE